MFQETFYNVRLTFFLSQKSFQATCLPVCKHFLIRFAFFMKTKVVLLISLNNKQTFDECIFSDKKTIQVNNSRVFCCAAFDTRSEMKNSSSLDKLGHLYKSAFVKYIRLMLNEIFSFLLLAAFHNWGLNGRSFLVPLAYVFLHTNCPWSVFVLRLLLVVWRSRTRRIFPHNIHFCFL